MTVFSDAEARHLQLVVNAGGQDVVLKVRTDTTPTANTPTITIVNHAFKAIISGYKTGEEGSLVRASDRKATISPRDLTVVPSIKDRLEIGSVDHEIIAVKQVAPSGTNLLFVLQLRA